MVTKLRDILCKIEITIVTNKGDYNTVLNLDDYSIEMTVPELLDKAKEWFENKMESI
jgi:hypothetical protein